jgi:PAS domain-containing protein
MPAREWATSSCSVRCATWRVRRRAVALVGLLLAGTVLTLLRRLQARNRSIAVAMFAEQERARVTLHSIGDAVITTDASQSVAYLNPVAERLTQWSLAEPAAGLWPKCACWSTKGRCSRYPRPWPGPCATGSSVRPAARKWRWCGATAPSLAIEESAAPIRDQDGRVVGGAMVFRDCDRHATAWPAHHLGRHARLADRSQQPARVRSEGRGSVAERTEL